MRETPSVGPIEMWSARQGESMKISLFLEHPVPKPWSEDKERQVFQDALDLVELADRVGVHCVWITEHHFLEEYSHSSAPEIFLAAASQRTKNIRLGHGIMHMPPNINHPFRVAERISTLDLVSNGRVEFGSGESSTVAELDGFRVDPGEKRAQWEEATRAALRCMTETPFTGLEGKYISMPARNVIPKPVQKPHPPLWLACTRPNTTYMAAELGMGALGFSFVSPEDMTDRVTKYYETFEEKCVPLGYEVNPKILAIGGDQPLMCAPSEEQAVAALGAVPGGGFFGFGIMYYYNFGMHAPGNTDLWAQYAGAISADPTVGYGPDRGPVGTPEMLRAWCERYEAAGVDECMFLINPDSHEANMESLELFGKTVLPELVERDETFAKERAARLAPAIERAMARRPADDAPALDPEYKFGGVPTSAVTGKTADEALIAIQEMAAAQERDQKRRAAALENLGRPTE
jgi:alkanesulfonate monooxygenase SsuD/methylene tetrahydromethanopterin reductase-like flavin-dependent oxidoreductase (luciferase family)